MLIYSQLGLITKIKTENHMKKKIQRWCACIGVILLSLLVLSGCELRGLFGSDFSDTSKSSPIASPTASQGGAYIAFVRWSVLPAPWKKTDGNESWDQDGPWSVGSVLQTYSSGKTTIDTNGVHRFEAAWNSIPGMDEANGSISLIFNETENVITEFNSKNIDAAGDNLSEFKLKGTNIPLVSDSSASRMYEVTGTETCKHISDNGAYMESHNFLGIGGIMYAQSNPFVCDANSFIRIQLVTQ
jgi:hypothetical protein